MMPQLPFPAGGPVSLRRKIYELLLGENKKRGRLPSQDDLRRVFGGETEDVDLHLEQLAREGMLILDKDGGNGISLAPTYVTPSEPGLMRVVADLLSLAGNGTFGGSIGLDLRGSELPVERGVRVVQVLDDRMSDANILQGDLAILVNSQPMRGSIVGIEQADVVILRRYTIVAGIPHFLAENPVAPDLIPAWDATLCGVFWGLIRANQCLLPQPSRPSDLAGFTAASGNKRATPQHSVPGTVTCVGKPQYARCKRLTGDGVRTSSFTNQPRSGELLQSSFEEGGGL